MSPHDDRRIRASHVSVCALGWLILSAVAPGQYGPSSLPFDLLRPVPFASNPPSGFPSEAAFAVSDLDLDGAPDLVAITPTGFEIQFIRGDGTLRRSSTIVGYAPNTHRPWSVHIHDLNGDGLQDIFILHRRWFHGAYAPAHPIGVYVNGPPGVFTLLASVGNNMGLGWGDFGVLISPRIDARGSRVLANVYGYGHHFGLDYFDYDPVRNQVLNRPIYATSRPPQRARFLGLADVDGDGIDEIAYDQDVTGGVFDRISVFGYDPATRFHGRLIDSFPRPAVPGAARIPAAVGDIDHDGRDDVLSVILDGPFTSASPTYRIAVARLDPFSRLFSWSAPIPLPAPNAQYSELLDPVQLVDLNQDRYLDLIVTWTRRTTSGNLLFHALHIGNGDGTFRSGVPFLPTTQNPLLLEGFADLDGDGDQDILAHRSNAGAWAYRNRTIDGDRELLATLFEGVTTHNNAIVPHTGLRIGLEGAALSSAAILGIGLTRRTTLAPDGRILDPTDLLIDPGLFGTLLTDPQGRAGVSFPIPNDPALIGLTFTAQWYVQGRNGWRGSAPAMLFFR